MLQIKTFIFNFINVNTYLLYDETKEAVIIDAGNATPAENEELKNFVEKEKLNVKYIISTHPHIDHVLGNDYCRNQFGAKLLMHKAGLSIYDESYAYCIAFGFNPGQFPPADQYIEEKDIISFGKQHLEVIETPGHADGSVCLINHRENLIFVGDVLFEGSIGRTDLPTGNYDLLISSIKNKIIPLPDDMIVYSGHGDTTTIGNEKMNNPYL